MIAVAGAASADEGAAPRAHHSRAGIENISLEKTFFDSQIHK